MNDNYNQARLPQPKRAFIKEADAFTSGDYLINKKWCICLFILIIIDFDWQENWKKKEDKLCYVYVRICL